MVIGVGREGKLMGGDCKGEWEVLKDMVGKI